MLELPGKVELAHATALNHLLLGSTYEGLYIGRGHEAEDMAVPRVVFHCYNFDEEPDQTGNGFCEVVMTVRSSADRHEDSDDPVATHNALLAAVSEIWRDDLAELLSAAVPALTVEEEMESLPGAQRVENRCFVTEKRWRVYAYNCALED